MKIFVEKSTFSNELKLFQGIFEKKSLMDILQNIKITANENNSVELVATDLEIGLTTIVDADVKEEGTFTVNGKDLYDLVSKMEDGLVEISENDDLQVLITNERKTSKYKLPALQSSDYPELPSVDFSENLKIPMDKLSSIINTNYYIVSPEIKFNLGGALMTIKNNKFEMAATDGHRLSYSFYEDKNQDKEKIEFIISRKTLLELLKLGSNGDIEFSYDKNNIFFRYFNKILSSRIIDQKFPNYKAVIPDETEFTATINKELLLKTLRRVLIFKTRNNGVIFGFSNNKLTLDRTTPDKGEAHDEIKIEYNGNNIDVAFNGGFIIDFLTHTNCENFEIGMNNKESSFVFKPIKESDLKNIYVVMPLNL